MKQKVLLIGIIFLGRMSIAQIPPGALVPYQSLLDINPSFAGSNGFVRDQALLTVPAINGASSYYSGQNNFDAYLSPLKSGIGVSASYEKFFNIYRVSSGNITYSKYIKVYDEIKIIPSLQAGMLSRTASLYTHDGGWISKDYFTFSSGFLVNHKNFYAGIAAFNLNYVNREFPDVLLRPIFNIHASYNMDLLPNLSIHFFGQISSQNYGRFAGHVRRYSTASAMNIICFKRFICGLGHLENLIGDYVWINAGFRTNYFTLQVASNWNVRGIQDVNFNRWQLMLSLNLRNKEQRKTFTTVESW